MKHSCSKAPCYLTIIAFFLFLSNLGISQEKLDLKIDSLLNVGNIDLAIKYYKIIELNSKLDKYQYLEIASCYSRLDKKDSAFYYITKVFECDSSFADVNTFIKSNFYYLKSDDRWYPLLSRITKNYFSHKKNPYDINYAQSLISLAVDDKSFYYQVYLSEKINGKDSPITVALWELKKQINKENITQLEKLISKYGWPTFTKVENFAAFAFLIIQHSTVEIQKKFLPLIEDAYKKNEAHFNWIAMITDRILLYEGKPQKYGTQSIWNPIQKKYVLYILENPENVNELRSKYEIGEPLSIESIKNMYDPNQ